MGQKRSAPNTVNVLAVIMGGGAGSRLFPLTKERSKPAVPLAGKYRLVDIPISNCINSNLKRIYLLTQFNSASLHRHISQSYKFDHFGGGFVEILAAEQTPTDMSWYQGTADAVRKNLVHFVNNDFEYMVILSGDQLYRMDFRRILAQHVETYADVTVATMPVLRKDTHAFGIMEINEERRITRFVEKPKDPEVLESFRLDPHWYPKLDIEGNQEYWLASMGIYVFNRDVLIKLLENAEWNDFGKHVIPQAIASRSPEYRIFSYVFQGYWEDIGTIGNFFEANLDVTSELPRFNFFDMNAPIFTRPRFLPASKINGGQIDHAVISDGCILNRATISNSIIGVRSIVGEGSHLHRVIMLGCDYYESQASILENEILGKPRIGIGRNVTIDNAIIDKNARIGDGVKISPCGKPDNVDHDLYYIRDGVVIIPKNAVIPNDTVL
ncbi:MAG TPA: glucose-1-phosphate adenylyltransferase [Candidatus Binatia bacterium]|nr:glucose-1-phosphate adenylyltransferase [Candidatus Binatia bacterium]